MDRVMPLSMATSAPATMHTITIALCASSKKHVQSFDALRAAGRLHNERLVHFQQQAGRSDVCGHEREATTSEEKGCNLPDSKSRIMSPLLGSDPTSYASHVSAVDSSGCGRGAAADSLPRSDAPPSLFRFVNLNYDAQQNRMTLSAAGEISDESSSSSPTGTATNEHEVKAAGQITRPGKNSVADSTPRDAVELDQRMLSDEVDVVLHKVTTFGAPCAIVALKKWCHLAQRRRNRQRRAPLIVLDPLENTFPLMSRRALCKFLNKTANDGRPIAPIPPTFIWDRSTGVSCSPTRCTASSSAAIPLSNHSFRSMGGKPDGAGPHEMTTGRWWVAKPDDATGPAFTHHLVMWFSRDANVTVPGAVEAVLPTEAHRFIVQEFYFFALPVLVKVYCVGSNLSLKVCPTVNLLARLWKQTNSSTAVNVPVMIDSQDKALFSADPLLAPAENWSAFFAPGTPAFTAIRNIAHSIAGAKGIDLSLLGFDLVLLPNHLAHPCYFKGAHGIGHTQGASVQYSRVVTSPSRETNSSVGTPGTSPELSGDLRKGTEPHMGAAVPSNRALELLSASDMFDPLSGAPTPLLLDSIPVVIDANYFPGYKGVDGANQELLELIATRAMHAQNESTSQSQRRRASSSLRA